MERRILRDNSFIYEQKEWWFTFDTFLFLGVTFPTWIIADGSVVDCRFFRTNSTSGLPPSSESTGTIAIGIIIKLPLSDFDCNLDKVDNFDHQPINVTFTIVMHISTCNMNIPKDKKANVVNAMSNKSFRPISLEPLS